MIYYANTVYMRDGCAMSRCTIPQRSTVEVDAGRPATDARGRAALGRGVKKGIADDGRAHGVQPMARPNYLASLSV